VTTWLVWPYFTVPLEGHIRQVWLYMYSCWRSNYQQREGWDSNNLLTPATFLLVYTRHMFTCLHQPHFYLFTPTTFLLVYTHHIFTCLHPPHFYLCTPATFLPVYTRHILTCLHPPHFDLFNPTHFCICPNPEPGFPMSWSFFCSMNRGERWLLVLLILVELLTISV
jgi:hypothetical protein